MVRVAGAASGLWGRRRQMTRPGLCPNLRVGRTSGALRRAGGGRRGGVVVDRGVKVSRWVGVETWGVAFVLAVWAPAAHADPCEGASPPVGARFSGVVRYVGDGDGLCIGQTSDPSGWIEVRLADFYAPELQQPGGPEAKAALERIVLGRRVACVAGRRSYDRVVARCTVEGVSLGDLLRRAGVVEGGRGR